MKLHNILNILILFTAILSAILGVVDFSVEILILTILLLIYFEVRGWEK